jgi:tRNA-dihydrouridine synthase A
MLNRLVSIAPMMDYTDKHDRYFLRLLSPHILLYTEMVTTAALLHGDVKHLLQFNPAENPIALQLGGNNPQDLAHCAKLGEDYGYDEININVGCPSDRVKSGQFGACLMLNPNLVAECVQTMAAAVKLPITVKCRIGVDHDDSYEQLQNFIRIVASSGCKTFIIHARKAWLSGLSPKQNREVPPLRYDIVQQIKQDFPELEIILNGGIKTLAAIEDHLKQVDGVMLGREAYSNPYLLAEFDNKIFGKTEKALTRHEIVAKMMPYITAELQNKTKLASITRHMLGLFQGQPGARSWRRHLSENAYRADSSIDVLIKALEYV